MRMSSLCPPAGGALLAALMCAVAGCSLREVPVEVGRTHLRSVALANYDRVGGGLVERLIDLLSSDPRLVRGDSEVASGDVAGMQVEPAAPWKLMWNLTLMTEVLGYDGRRVLAAVRDGDILLDGFGRTGSGDGINLRWQADAACTVYVILVDASGQPHTLFPNTVWSTVGNPVLAGRPYRLPEGNILFELGPTRGLETLYLIASPEPWLELEELLGEVEAFDWNRLPVPAVVERAALIFRGVGDEYASTAHAVGGPAGTLTDVNSTLYVGQSEARLVITRWFRHR